MRDRGKGGREGEEGERGRGGEGEIVTFEHGELGRNSASPKCDWATWFGGGGGV